MHNSGTSLQINFQGVMWSGLQMLKDSSSAAVFCEEISEIRALPFQINSLVIAFNSGGRSLVSYSKEVFISSGEKYKLCQDLKFTFGV